MSTLSYTELSKIRDFNERFEYLKLKGIVGEVTFGSRRPINQTFYRSAEWHRTRRHILIRDSGCDMGLPGFEIPGTIIVHHMVPITEFDISGRDLRILDPEFLVCVSVDTHNAIHYGNGERISRLPTERTAGDTSLWSTLSYYKEYLNEWQ